MAEQFDVYGTWKLEGFPDALKAWQEAEPPPAELVTQVEAWWPRMEFTDEHTRATPLDEDGPLVIWVPGCEFIDETGGLFSVQCYFRVLETGHRVVCEALHTARRMRPDEVDRADGMS